MKKVFLIFISFCFVYAGQLNWYPVHTYKSVKKSDNLYRVILLNKGDFTENNLFVDKKNDRLLKEGKCVYRSVHEPAEKIFDFNGTGAIVCNGKPIAFISKKVDFYFLPLFIFAIIKLLYIELPIVILFFLVMFYFITGRKTDKKGLYYRFFDTM